MIPHISEVEQHDPHSEHHHEHSHDDCFEHTRHKAQSFEAVLEVASETEGSFVVHGWIRMANVPNAPWILHAWAELDEAIYDLTESRDPQNRADWYISHGVTEERLRRYDRVTFFTLFAETGCFGPYDKDLFFAAEYNGNKDPLQR